MPLGYTFAMIKPQACRKNHVGPILAMINQAGFRISAIRSTKLTRDEAEKFYEMHRGKPFYEGLVEFMSSGPIVALLLEKENAIEDFRKLIGNTDPSKAEEGTIRKMFAESLQRNAIHGADTPENAKREADFFFNQRERY
ncbi:MAG: nucleoside-diphosphate kinase [Bacteroidetes bacterium GWC2_33_15]|nr:MAG: nucleoside-diphosphate kinase [Bacteroidetes bacterium GWA2_33_15]OFX49743.1 MAG: nucleoside-diphosphate kinase [Bacteroidetes bacterium GWC2_33_15]OFX65867.1 MAG: nucleoside-diphosphate kinase [Bacteroidetes bacterium GWB2_32_14]OFX68372.1 MAG: nucleoside-diphosphate kinase [Bacteroidetes bacterium GWD2_33_33]HAN18161.1 nucleoside-diphosphate kinase [Bacteroidales bacterium]